MGYQGEKASLNQYSDLLDYCKKNVVTELQDIFDINMQQEFEIRKQILAFIYEPKPPCLDIPLLSFDGGMANLFQGQMTETCILKVAGACPPEFNKHFATDDLKEVFFHTFIGRLGYVESEENKEATAEVIQKELNRLLNIEEFLTLLVTFDVEVKHFSDKFKSLVNSWKDKSAIKDCFRELLEWAMVIEFMVNYKKTNKTRLPFLIIKDGNLSSNAKAITGTLADKVRQFIKGENQLVPIPFIIGAVKSSRYTGDNAMGNIVKKFAKDVPSHSFFKLPKRFEAAVDKDLANNAFKRYFLSLFGGEQVFEIQIPIPLSEDEELRNLVLDLVASQVTFEYGGSISTNSYAHVRASLSEAEARVLQKTVFEELKKDSKND
jgi:hypothetical protein